MAVWDDIDPSEKLRIYDKGVERNPTSETLPQQCQLPARRRAHSDGRRPRAARRNSSTTCTPRGSPRGRADAHRRERMGYDVVRVLEAALRSAEQDGTKVEVGP